MREREREREKYKINLCVLLSGMNHNRHRFDIECLELRTRFCVFYLHQSRDYIFQRAAE